MSRLLHSFRKFTALELSILLCFLLPPIGMFMLLLLGLHTIYKNWWIKKRFFYSISSYFFLCLFISTIGASITMKEFSYLGVSLLILGYWGLYIRILEIDKNQFFFHFRYLMIFGGVYSCLIGWFTKLVTFPPVFSYLMGTVLFGKTEPKDYNRLIGCAYNPNFTVYILLIALSFLFANLLTSLRSKRFVSMVWQLPTILLLSYGVIQTGSRAGFASMILIYFLFIFRLNKSVFIISILFGLSISKWLLHLMPRADSVIQSSLVRQEIWKNAYKIWHEYPFFGVTPLGFGQEYLKHFNEFIPHGHNLLIGMFAEFGTLGGLAFLFIFGLNLIKCIHLFFSIQSNKCLLDCFLLGFPIILLTGIFDEPLFSPQIGFLTVIFLACWDRYVKRIHFVVEYQLFSRVHYLIYLRYLQQKIKRNIIQFSKTISGL